MVEKINTDTLLIEESAFLPESLRFESEPPSKGRRLVQDLDGCGLVRRIRSVGRSFFYVAVRSQTWWLFFLSLPIVAAVASAQIGSTVPSVETILARMAQARAENRARFRSYVVTRDYKLFGKERDKTKSEVIADVTFVPPDFKKYAIQQTEGTGLGEKIVRRMLEREVEVTKDYSSTDISPDNYDFRFLREENVSGQRCYVLELLPRRKDKNLLRGNIWVDANTYLLRRTEGKPAKAPSWWLRDVRIAFVYGDVGGMWLQTASEATAKVRILGQHTMVSRDLNYKISELVAGGSSPPTRF
jgi:outer membrane lipoprotein-sorting protein